MKRQKNKHKLLLGVLFLAGLLALFSYLRVYADSPSVVINEIMYNPASDVSNDEYIELYNTTASTVDLSGWCFTAGIGGCFSSGTTLAAHSYALASPNAARTLATYGKNTIATYTGNLSNGGETVTLSNASNQVINSLTYDDVAPWPTSPDGGGPSLELKDAALDNSQASSWGASISPTPGEQNSLANLEPPTIHSASHPAALQPVGTVKITADVDDATSVNLIYKVMFNTEQTLAMNDNGTAGDDTAADGIYTAQIPAQAAGSLVRFKIQANNSDGLTTLPSSNESINYRSYIVDDGQSADLPIVRWYIDPAVYDDLVNNHSGDDTYVPTVVAVGDQIFDNAKVKVKGQSSTNYPKKKFTFDLPSGQQLGSPYFEHPVDEFSLNVYFLNMTDLQEKLAWMGFSNYGFDGLQSQYVRVQKNNSTDTSDFFGHYLMIESYDSNWRERTNHQSGALYKQFDDKKTRKDEDDSDIVSLRSSLQNLTGDNLKNYILDNLDVPSVINYDALSTILMSQDWGFYKNLYEYRDTEGTGRWSLLPWDLDNALAMPMFKDDSSPMYFNLDPLESNRDPLQDSNESGYMPQRFSQLAMYQFPEFREMYYRRVATLYDQIYKSGQLLGWYTELFNKSKDTINQDLPEWQDEKAALLSLAFPSGFPWEFPDDFPFDITPEQIMSGEATADTQDVVFHYGYARFITRIEAERSAGNLPQTQAANPEVIFSEVNYNPSSGEDGQYIELYNPNSEAVDLSGWQLSGAVSTTFPQGSVIPAHSYGLIVKNDPAFRQQYPGSQLILAEYQGSLTSQQSNQLSLSHANQISTKLNYGTDLPWPNLAGGSGLSLALAKLDGDYTSAYCWAPSSTTGGTPGSANNLDQNWVSHNIANCKVRANTAASLAGTGQPSNLLLMVGLLLSLSSLYALFLKYRLKLLMIKV